MNKALTTLSNYLKDRSSNDIDLAIDIVIDDIKDISKNSVGYISKSKPILRTLQSLKSEYYIDFIGHLRQVMVYSGLDFDIDEDLAEKIAKFSDDFNITISKNPFKISCNKYILSNDNELKSLYEFERRRNISPSIGDGRLYKYFKYENYSSLPQKILNYLVSTMEPKQTLLACLPTGGGKSLSWQLPGISNSFDGLIIVVVPTIALAIDHEKSSKTIFSEQFGIETLPKAYYGSIDDTHKEMIFKEIENSTLPILYISPEALLSNEFKSRVMKAASENKVSSLFVDEAHLVIHWGMKFRPEFQFLSAFCEELNKVSSNGIKTVLLSATITEEESQILRNIFNYGNFYEFRADELRSEPSFYAKLYNSSEKRLHDTLKLVCQSPRPIIIYTLNPKQAKQYYDEIIKYGFKNVCLFTGETNNTDRSNVISEWNHDKLDIIIATSAFGMGVDKSDVRTIISVYQPESISRFYQEVGRAGRDGYASLSYLLFCPEEDSPGMRSLIKSSVLKSENIANRWQELYSHSKFLNGDCTWIDAGVVPIWLSEGITGNRNIDWNYFVILFLHRHGFIQIKDIKSDNNHFLILVNLKKIDILENREILIRNIEPFRQAELNRVQNSSKYFFKMIQSVRKNCISYNLVSEFTYTTPICSGCPYCREVENSNSNYSITQINIIGSEPMYSYTKNHIDLLDTYIQANDTLILRIENYSSEYINNLVFKLVQHDVNIIVTNIKLKNISLFERLSFSDKSKYMILNFSELQMTNPVFIPGVLAIIIDKNTIDFDEMYKYVLKYLGINSRNRVIYSIQSDIYVKFEGKRLSDLVEQSISLSDL